MDDIPGTAEQKVSLMLLERIDALTDLVNKPELPDAIEYYEDRYERNYVCFLCICLKPSCNTAKIYYDYICQHLYRQSNIDRFATDVPNYWKPIPLMLNMLVYFKKKESVKKFVYKLYKVIKEETESIKVQCLSHRTEITYYECLVAAGQQEIEVGKLLFGEEERLECDAPRLEHDCLTGYDIKGTKDFKNWPELLRVRVYCESRGEVIARNLYNKR
jgi:hypothetical protein